MLPPNATAVVMVEFTKLASSSKDGDEEKEIEISLDHIQHGENVREEGSDVKQGDVIVPKSTEIMPLGGELGLLMSTMVREIYVYRQPTVGVLSTGSELVDQDDALTAPSWQVLDTNRSALLLNLRRCGFNSVDLGIVTDEYARTSSLLFLSSFLPPPSHDVSYPLLNTPYRQDKLQSALRQALEKVDVLVTSGGVSMGELDLLPTVIEKNLGGKIHFGRVSMKPGKPTTFSTVPTSHGRPSLIFSLPGNPASAMVSFYVFVLPCLQRMSGYSSPGKPKVHVTLANDITRDRHRLEYHRTIVSVRADGKLYANSTGGQRSSRIGSFAGANALLIIEPGTDVVKAGEVLPALLIGGLQAEER